MLSTFDVIGFWALGIMPKFNNSRRIQIAPDAAAELTTYSNFIIVFATEFYFLLEHETAPPPSKKIYPDIGLESSRSSEKDVSVPSYTVRSSP